MTDHSNSPLSTSVTPLVLGMIRIRRIANPKTTPEDFSVWVEGRFGWPRVRGTVRRANGSYAQHWWNALPDGLLDAFCEVHDPKGEPRTRIVLSTDKAFAKYEESGADLPPAPVIEDDEGPLAPPLVEEEPEDEPAPSEVEEPVAATAVVVEPVAPPQAEPVPELVGPKALRQWFSLEDMKGVSGAGGPVLRPGRPPAASPDAGPPPVPLDPKEAGPKQRGGVAGLGKAAAAGGRGPDETPTAWPEPQAAPPEAAKAITVLRSEDDWSLEGGLPNGLLGEIHAAPRFDAGARGAAAAMDGGWAAVEAAPPPFVGGLDADDNGESCGPDDADWGPPNGGAVGWAETGDVARLAPSGEDLSFLEDDFSRRDLRRRRRRSRVGPYRAEEGATEGEPAAAAVGVEPPQPRKRRPWAWGAVALVALVVGAAPVVGSLTGSFFVVPVRSEAMEPAIAAGALGVARPVAAADIRKGDIVVVKAPLPGSPRVVRRVLDVRSNAERVTLVTKGDSIESADPWITDTAAAPVWRMAITVPMVGRLLSGADAPLVRGAAALVALLSAWVFLGAGRGRRRTARQGVIRVDAWRPAAAPLASNVRR